MLLIVMVTTNQLFAQGPVANFTVNKTTGCAPLTVIFTDQSTGSPFAWNWDLGNGQLSTLQNPAVTYTNPGTYSIRLVVRSADGIDEEIKTDLIVVSASPNASFSSNLNTACVPALIQFSDQSTIPANAGTIQSWLWDFGDGSTSGNQNPAHTYTATGFYAVSLTVTSSTGCQSGAVINRFIRVVNGIDANFEFSQSATCRPPYNIQFNDQSSGPGNFTYSWNFGNGGPGSSLQNPSAIYNAAGTYPVELTVQSSLGCVGVIKKDVVLVANNTNFTNPASNCNGKPVSFVNASTPAPINSSWDFGDGTTSSQINPIKTYFTSGTYTVKLVNEYASCSDSVTKTIVISSAPVVDFTASKTSSCLAPFTTQFTDNSSGASTWLWDFGDGTTSTLQNPTHTYTAFGKYDVRLTITIGAGCSNSVTRAAYINVNAISGSLTTGPLSGCTAFNFSPTPNLVQTDPVISYLWNFGEAGATSTTPNPTYIYSNPGTFPVSLVVTTANGCSTTLTAEVRTGVAPIADFIIPLSTCASDSVQFINTSSNLGANTSYSWDFGDGGTSTLQSPRHKFKKIGSVPVTLIVSNNGCNATVTKNYIVTGPVANFGYQIPAGGCGSTTISFVDSSQLDPGPVSYEWQPDILNPTIVYTFSNPLVPVPQHTYSSFGTFTSRLIVTNGSCKDTVDKKVILPNVNPDFTASKTTFCKGEVIQLSATNADPSIVKYIWSFNGVIAQDTTASISVSFQNAGPVDVRLTTVDINKCEKTKNLPGYLTVTGPSASFTGNGPGVCISKPYLFNDLSTSAGSIISWQFDFGDGKQQSFNQAPFTHTYTDEGKYQVSLTVTDNNNCTNTFTNSIGVLITRPRADFKVDSIYCPGVPLTFTDRSNGSGLKYAWLFGDGNSSALRNPTNIYPLTDANYTVQLAITDTAGCSDTISRNQFVKIRSPKAAFEITDSTGICLPLQTSFTFKGLDYESFTWDFGDGGLSNLKDPRHFYSAGGTFKPTLYVTGPGGCMDSVSREVIVYNTTSIPLNADQLEGCNILTTTFSFNPPPGFRYLYSFGDGTIDTTQQSAVVHTFKSPGDYSPVVVLTDNTGCENLTARAYIKVYGTIPLFGKSRKEFCDAGAVSFSNYTISNEPLLSSTWDFGDGTTSTDKDPTHTYTSPGTYVVSLNTLTQSKCVTSFFDTIRVYRTPVINIVSRDTLCLATAENFSAALQTADTSIKWQWNFANGIIRSGQTEQVTYPSAGDFNVQLISSNKIGCADTAVKKINVVPKPLATAIVNPLQIISGASATLAMNYQGAIINYNWSPTSTLDCRNCATPVSTPRVSTAYTVQVTDRYGCFNSGSIQVNVVCADENFFIPNTFSPNGDGSNDRFYPRGRGVYSIRSLLVFNRWGELVYQKRDFPVNDANSGWDGMYKGKKASADVYVYQAEIVCNNGEVIKLSGNIALIL